MAGACTLKGRLGKYGPMEACREGRTVCAWASERDWRERARLARASIVAVAAVLVPSLGVNAESPPLPGPGLDLPVDVDGSGTSTYGDQWVFNWWLAHGGSFDKALSAAQATGDTIDLSAFFNSPDAALSPDSPLALGASWVANAPAAAEGGPAILAPCTCTTSAQMDPDFGGGGNGFQTGCVYCETFVLHQAHGHAVRSGSTGGFVYVALEGGTANDAGITKIDLTNIISDASVPISGSRVQKLFSGFSTIPNFTTPPQVAWDNIANPANGRLVFTANHSSTSGRALAVSLDANGNNSGNPFDLFQPGSMRNPFGIDFLPSGFCSFGNPGELFLAEDTSSSPKVKKRGVNSSTPCPTGSTTLFNAVSQRARGIEIGNQTFGNDASFGVYYATLTTTARIVWVHATNPNTFTQSDFASLTGGPTPSNIAFDPFATSTAPDFDNTAQRMYVSDSRSPGFLWAVKSGYATVVVTNLERPQGISFPESGVMLISEQTANRVIVVDGFRWRFKRGDINSDGDINVVDRDFLLDWLFSGGPAPTCWDAADVNDDSVINSADATYLTQWLCCEGPDPPAPFPACGRDPTIDLLGCVKGAPDLPNPTDCPTFNSCCSVRWP